MKKTLTALLLGLSLPVLAGSCSPVARPEMPETEIERRLAAPEKIVFYDKESFSQRDQETIQNALKELAARYSLGYDITVLNLGKIDESVAQHNGYAYPLLGCGGRNREGFIRIFGREMYDKLKGRDVIAVKGSELFEKTKSLSTSLYVTHPSKEADYEFYILHEMIHPLIYRIMTQELGAKICEIDIKNKIYEANDNIGEIVYFTNSDGTKGATTKYREGERPTHPAHASFHSFFWVGFPELCNEDKTHQAEEQATETTLYHLKGYVDENVEDKLLAEKIRLIRQALKPFERK